MELATFLIYLPGCGNSGEDEEMLHGRGHIYSLAAL